MRTSRLRITFHSSNSTAANDGFVLITALMVIFLIIAIVSSVAMVTASDLKASARARAIIKTRFVAESVSDTVYARIAGLKNGFLSAAQGWGIDSTVTPPVNTNNPLMPENPGDPDSWGRWFALDENGGLKDCQLVSEICFRAKIRQISGGSVVMVGNRDEIALDLIVRGGCFGSSLTDLRNCIYRQFQSRYRTRSYVDSVAIADSERSDLPGVPVDPDPLAGGQRIRTALIPSDEIHGGFVSNDTDGFLFCGAIDSSDVNDLRSVASGTTNLGGFFPASNTTCNGTITLQNPNQSVKFLPGQLDTSGSTSLGQTQSIFSALARGGGFEIPGGSTISLGIGTVTLNSDPPRSYPSNGVIYALGAITINASTASRPLTIYSEGNVVINGNIDTSDSGAIVGIATPGDIIINCPPGGPCPSRNITGVLKAGGKIYNNSWDNSPRGATDPVITITGSLISAQRAIFGSYTSDSGATLVNGWRKNLIFDDRLLDNQPPFFFRTTQASVVRSSLDEDRCTVVTICS